MEAWSIYKANIYFSGIKKNVCVIILIFPLIGGHFVLNFNLKKNYNKSKNIGREAGRWPNLKKYHLKNI